MFLRFGMGLTQAQFCERHSRQITRVGDVRLRPIADIRGSSLLLTDADIWDAVMYLPPDDLGFAPVCCGAYVTPFAPETNL